MTQKEHKESKKKINKLDFCKIKTFCNQGQYQESEKTTHTWEKILPSHYNYPSEVLSSLLRFVDILHSNKNS